MQFLRRAPGTMRTDRGQGVPRFRVLVRAVMFTCLVMFTFLMTAAIAVSPAQKDASSASQAPSGEVDAARRKQIADDSANLLKMATDLKAEVDKSNKDTLSLSVIRKAEEIEKLAHSVRDRVKPTKSAR